MNYGLGRLSFVGDFARNLKPNLIMPPIRYAFAQ
jgi:hypothetical protein